MCATCTAHALHMHWHASDTQHSTKHRAPGMAPGVAPGTWRLVWHLAPGTWHLVWHLAGFGATESGPWCGTLLLACWWHLATWPSLCIHAQPNPKQRRLRLGLSPHWASTGPCSWARYNSVGMYVAVQDMGDTYNPAYIHKTHQRFDRKKQRHPVDIILVHNVQSW